MADEKINLSHVATSDLMTELKTRFDTLLIFGEQVLGNGKIRCFRVEEGSPFSIAGAAAAIQKKYEGVAMMAMIAEDTHALKKFDTED